MRLKVFHGKSWNTPIMHKIFLGALNFLNHWRDLHKFFGTVRQKQSTESWYPNYPTNFETRAILKHKRVHPRWLLAMWDKKKFKKLRYSYYLKTFDTKTILKHRSVRARCFSVIWDIKNFDGKTWHSLLIHIFFRTRKFLNHKSVPHEVFRYRETKTFPRNVAELLFYA